MCSVVGYVGKNFSRDFIMEGLSRLEYRGYDSAGFACLNSKDNQLFYAKATGKLENLAHQFNTNSIDGHVSIGHTRWATHGASSHDNAHPHFDCFKKISIVHNGIVENYHILKNYLQKSGHVFYSETDTEVVAHLFESLLCVHKSQSYVPAVTDLVKRLEGAFAFIIVSQDYPDAMVLVRKRSPLCIGIGDGEMFIASDILAFAGKTNQVVFLPDESFAIVHKDRIELYDFTGSPLPIDIQVIDYTWDPIEKQGHEHYMLKEIYEQKGAIRATLDYLDSLHDVIWDHVGLSLDAIKNLKKINLIGCGTSWHAARIAQFFFEEICALPVNVSLASEFRYTKQFSQEDSIYMTISQSGETADTLEALRLVNGIELPTVALTNVVSSSMVREAGGFLLTKAGPEVAVASTKAFSTQLAALYWFAHRIALERGVIAHEQMQHAKEEILIAAEVLENTIEIYKRDIERTHAKTYARYDKAIFLGRHTSYPFAMEAALKLKEIAYIFSQCYPAGELKHGPLALVDEHIPVFIFSHQDPVIYQKLLANTQEVKARKGHIVAFMFDGQNELAELADLVFIIPKVSPLLGSLAMTGVMQFLVYAIAKELNLPIDKPRNLAKSVTVE